jgi:hypothetical protein
VATAHLPKLLFLHASAVYTTYSPSPHTVTKRPLGLCLKLCSQQRSNNNQHCTGLQPRRRLPKSGASSLRASRGSTQRITAQRVATKWKALPRCRRERSRTERRVPTSTRLCRQRTCGCGSHAPRSFTASGSPFLVIASGQDLNRAHLNKHAGQTATLQHSPASQPCWMHCQRCNTPTTPLAHTCG